MLGFLFENFILKRLGNDVVFTSKYAINASCDELSVCTLQPYILKLVYWSFIVFIFKIFLNHSVGTYLDQVTQEFKWHDGYKVTWQRLSNNMDIAIKSLQGFYQIQCMP